MTPKVKKKKKNSWEGIERGIEEEEDKALKNYDLIPFFFLNMIFDWSRGIEKHVKTDSIDGEESKKNRDNLRV